MICPATKKKKQPCKKASEYRGRFSPVYILHWTGLNFISPPSIFSFYWPHVHLLSEGIRFCLRCKIKLVKIRVNISPLPFLEGKHLVVTFSRFFCKSDYRFQPLTAGDGKEKFLEIISPNKNKMLYSWRNNFRIHERPNHRKRE